MRVWIDIDNPPQARYLLPLVHRFEEAGHDVLLTARAYGDTFAILKSEGASFEPIGSSFGKGIPRKLYGVLKRRRQLITFLEQQLAQPDLVVTGSRSASLAARKLGISSFVIIDYEYVNLLVYRLAGAHIVHPNVIDGGIFERRGIRPELLMPFDGLKEDIAFADVDLFAVTPHDFGDGGDPTPHVLFRPPAEESHYYRSESRDLALELLRFLAARGARIVFSPRHSKQVAYLDEVQAWQEEPIILRDPVPFVALLKGVDAVISAGGTMLREAAYLGVPAYSIFRGNIGAVDRYLASIDRLTLVASPADFSRIALARKATISPLRRDDSRASEQLMKMILDRASASNDDSRRSAVRSPSAPVRRESRSPARPSRPPQ
jgi:predicted glycosyltransferase